MSTSSPTNGAMTAAAAGRRSRTSRRSGGSAGHDAGHVQPAVDGQAGEEDVGEPELGSRAPGRDVPHVADDSQEAADPLHHLEVAEVPQRRLDVGLPRLVGDEHEPGVVAEALLLDAADAHVVLGEHAGDGVQHARPVDHLEREVVLGRGLVDRPDSRLRERAHRAVGALAEVDGGVDEVAEHGAGRRPPAGAPPVEHELADGAALDEHGVVAVAHAGQRVVARHHRRVDAHGHRESLLPLGPSPARRWRAA